MTKAKPKKQILSREILLEALNRIDEFASEAVRDNDNGEAQQLEKDYNLVHDFLKTVKVQTTQRKGNQKLDIPFSESDIQELQSGETFDWTFETDEGESIDIHIRPEEDEDNE